MLRGSIWVEIKCLFLSFSLSLIEGIELARNFILFKHRSKQIWHLAKVLGGTERGFLFGA